MRPLGFEATNFKKMIRWEEEDIDRIKRHVQVLKGKRKHLLSERKKKKRRDEIEQMKIGWVFKEHDEFEQRFLEFGDIYNESAGEIRVEESEQPKDKNPTQQDKLKKAEDFSQLMHKYE